MKFEQNVLNKLDEITSLLISLLDNEEVTGEVDKPLELEDHNLRINSEGWHKITKDGKSYLENQEKDVWEFLEGECKGEQLFTYDAAIRETKRAGKVIPTDKQLSELLKTKNDLKNITYPGNRYTDGSYNGLGWDLYLWSSTPGGSSNAWRRFLASSYSTVSRDYDARAYGFSVRCLR